MTGRLRLKNSGHPAEGRVYWEGSRKATWRKRHEQKEDRQKAGRGKKTEVSLTTRSSIGVSGDLQE